MSMASSAILSNFFEEKWTQNHPQYLLGLSRALFPITFLEIAVYKCNDMHLQNTTTITYRLTGMFINEAIIGTFGCIKHLFHHHRYSYFQFKNSFTPQLQRLVNLTFVLCIVNLDSDVTSRSNCPMMRRLFTVLYFSVRSSRSRALRYGLPCCMSVKTT